MWYVFFCRCVLCWAWILGFVFSFLICCTGASTHQQNYALRSITSKLKQANKFVCMDEVKKQCVIFRHCGDVCCVRGNQNMLTKNKFEGGENKYKIAVSTKNERAM